MNKKFKSQTNSTTNLDKSSESWIMAQNELIKIFPSALAILCDVWSFASKHIFYKISSVGNFQVFIINRLLLIHYLGFKFANFGYFESYIKKTLKCFNKFFWDCLDFTAKK